MRLLRLLALPLWVAPAIALAQEANSGFDLRATLSAATFGSTDLTELPRNGSPFAAGFRGVLYPTLKIDEHWTVTVALQEMSRPYFRGTYGTQGDGFKTDLLNATVNYSRTWERGLVTFRAGEMPAAFGSFLLRYDDMDNPLFDRPLEYGYYYSPVSTLAVAGAQLDMTQGKWDGRVQFANSSPANPRSLTARDQYGNWIGGAGYTIRQGLRAGVSASRGPYLYRGYAYFSPGEANPNTLPAHAIGADVQFSRGQWYTQAEIQRFMLPYKVTPTVVIDAGYFEVKRVLSARWYGAERIGHENSSFQRSQSFEFTAGFRPGRNQLIKLDFALVRESGGKLDRSIALQFVTTIHPVSLAFR